MNTINAIFFMIKLKLGVEINLGDLLCRKLAFLCDIGFNL